MYRRGRATGIKEARQQTAVIGDAKTKCYFMERIENIEVISASLRKTWVKCNL